ncbi:MAG: patatin-like phospholipase family protein [Pseudomonadota bacterium]|nr:patatin-like phospholipase family protein [Pseudomonadota bacterium]
MNRSTHDLTIQAGPRAFALLREHGLRAQDVAVVAGAAGGPKGLILQALDQWLFGDWLAGAPRQRTLIGASIGAWRMAAACAPDPAAAFQRLGDLYCAQHYSERPTPNEVSAVCRQILDDLIGDQADAMVTHADHHLQILIARGRRGLAQASGRLGTLAGFTGATLANLRARDGLAAYFERIIVGDRRARPSWLAQPFDRFTTQFAPLGADNLRDALLASGTLPLIMAPVTHIAHVAPGQFWDGGLIDYHLALPYARLGEGLVLYPHFTDHLVPGWLDKALHWRRAHRTGQRHWLDNVVLLSPSRAFLQRLPRQQLPDRSDFTHYGRAHAKRIANWRRAIGEGQRLRDALAHFVSSPDLAEVLPLY